MNPADQFRAEVDAYSDGYNEGYAIGFDHGFDDAIRGVEQVLLAKQRSVQAYGMDCEVIQIDEALDAIRSL